MLVLIGGFWLSGVIPPLQVLHGINVEPGTLKTIFLAVLFVLTWTWIFRAWRNSQNWQADPAPEHLRELAAALEMFRAGVKPHYGALAENMGDLIGAVRKEFARSGPGAVSIMLGLCGEFLRQKEMDELVRELPQMEAFRQQIAHALERAVAVHQRQAAPPSGAAG